MGSSFLSPPSTATAPTTATIAATATVVAATATTVAVVVAAVAAVAAVNADADVDVDNTTLPAWRITTSFSHEVNLQSHSTQSKVFKMPEFHFPF